MEPEAESRLEKDCMDNQRWRSRCPEKRHDHSNKQPEPRSRRCIPVEFTHPTPCGLLGEYNALTRPGVSSQGDRLQSGMDLVSSMLTEIHTWFVDNLKSTTATILAPSSDTPNETELSKSEGTHFEIFEPSGGTSVLICPRASLAQEVTQGFSSASPTVRHLFSCHCPSSGTDLANHRSTVGAYGRKILVSSTKISGWQTNIRRSVLA